MHGYGVCYYINGSKYEGQWVSDKRNGNRKYTWADGNVYIGEF